jgi:hypothetical protein
LQSNIPPMMMNAYRDFTPAGENGVEAMADYIKGNVSIYGKFTMDVMADIILAVGAALKLICGCSKRLDPLCVEDNYMVVTESVMDITTYGQEFIRLVINYWILPPVGGNTECADRVVVAGAGGIEPPFDKVPEPLFRVSVQAEFRLLDALSFIDINAPPWQVELPWPVCESGMVIRSFAMPTIPPEDRSDLACGDFANSAGAGLALSALYKPDWQEAGALCDFQSNPCMCSFVEGCAWLNMSGGEMRCNQTRTGASNVWCQYCPTQSKCPVSDAEVCASRAAPCQCANAAGVACVWVTRTKTCRVRDLDLPEPPTDCSVCPLQYHCSLPDALFREILPKAGLTLPSKDWGSSINVTFDRQMQFQLGSTGRIQPNVVQFVCRQPPPSDPILQSVPLFRLMWLNMSGDPEIEGSTHGQILNIEVNGTINEKPTDCDLVISDDAVKDLDDVSYLGLAFGEYTFGIQDTVAPIMKSFDPPNGAMGQALDSSITFTFNEEVRPGTDMRGVLYAFGGDISAAFLDNQSIVLEPSADQILAVVEFKPAAFPSDGRSIVIELNGLLSHETLYSLSLSPGCAQDVTENVFAGLGEGMYLFRTAVRNYIDKQPVVPERTVVEMLQEPTVLALTIILAVILWISSLACCLMVRRLRVARSRVAGHYDQQAPDLPLNKVIAWDGSFLNAQLQAENGTLHLEQGKPPSPNMFSPPCSPTASQELKKPGTPNSQRKAPPPAHQWRVADTESPAPPMSPSQSQSDTSPKTRRRAFENTVSPPASPESSQKLKAASRGGRPRAGTGSDPVSPMRPRAPRTPKTPI